MISRSFPIILTNEIGLVRDFYVELLGFDVAFDSDWFINLRAPGNDNAEIGIWRRDHELVPESIRSSPAGVIIDVVVTNVDEVYTRAEQRGDTIILTIRDEPYGQRRFITQDPAGTAVEISSPIPMDENFKG